MAARNAARPAMKQAEATESQEQKALVQWWDAACHSLGVPNAGLLFHIPNEGKRSFVMGRRLKAEGLRTGIPDLFLAVPVGIFHGLFIEMKKARGGRLSDEQREAIAFLRRQGYAAEVCRGFMEAKEAITQYLSPKSAGIGDADDEIFLSPKILPQEDD